MNRLLLHRLWASSSQRACAETHECSQGHRRPSRVDASEPLAPPGAMQPPSAVAALRGAAAHDPSSLANPGEARVVHADFALCLDFGRRVVAGSAALRVRVEAAGVAELLLDTRGLRVTSATWRAEGGDAAPCDAAPFAFGAEQGPLGAPLRVQLPAGLAKGTTGVVTLTFATAPDSSACQWLAPQQTAGGTHPYLFTQCQAIHARALLPLQDSPAAKLTCDAAALRLGACLLFPAPGLTELRSPHAATTRR